MKKKKTDVFGALGSILNPNPTQYIIRFGGLVPTYYAGDVHTCNPSEAKRFDTIDQVFTEYGPKAWEHLKGVSIVDADTLETVKMMNL